jgi:hypothetical protein
VFPERQCPKNETIDAGRMAAKEVPTAICAAASVEAPDAISP